VCASERGENLHFLNDQGSNLGPTRRLVNVSTVPFFFHATTFHLQPTNIFTFRREFSFGHLIGIRLPLNLLVIIVVVPIRLYPAKK
jgi:hypothetical protein